MEHAGPHAASTPNPERESEQRAIDDLDLIDDGFTACRPAPEAACPSPRP